MAVPESRPPSDFLTIMLTRKRVDRRTTGGCNMIEERERRNLKV